MQGVTLSKGVRQNLMAMQTTAKMMAETQNHLATGKKVNSALDNPTNFFTASALDSRAGDLNSLMDSVGNAVKTLEAADNGVKAITKLVESAQGTARQALQAAKGEITTAGAKGTLTGAATTSLADGETLVFTVDGTDTTVTFDGTEATDLATAAATITADVEGLTASVNATTGNLELTSDEDGIEIEVTNGTGGLAADLGFTTGVGSADEVVEVRGDSETRKSLEAEFDALLTQIDQLTKDSGFNGNNFLNGDDLKVVFNETGDSSLTIKGVDASSSGLGLSATTTGDFQDDTKIEAVLKSLDTATTSLRSTSSTFGSNLSTVQTRQDFTENMINTLESGASNLTMADLNQEGANMLALQTRQSLATTAMSMASRADQSVLSLLR